MAYEVGDALGLYPKNCPGVVSYLIAKLGFIPEAPVTTADGKNLPLHEALLAGYEIRQLLTKEVSYENVEAFLADLRKIQPRLYSISSSP